MKIAFFVLCIVSVLPVKAQHPYYASPDQQLLMLNPAFAGNDKRLRIQTIGGVTDVNTSFSASSLYVGADLLLGKHHGLGITFHNQQFGQLFLKNEIDLNYAFHFGGKKLRIAPAVKISYCDVRIKTNDLLFGDMISAQSGFVWNTAESRPEDTIRNCRISSGFLMYNKIFYFGASWLDYLKLFGERDFSRPVLPGVIVTQASGTFNLKNIFRLQIYCIGKIELPDNNMYQYGLYFGHSIFTVHLAHRFNDALITGFNLNEFGLKIGYNNQYHYKPDYPSKFSHEIYLSMNFSKIIKS